MRDFQGWIRLKIERMSQNRRLNDVFFRFLYDNIESFF
jgi:hypothetical protein